MKRSFRGGLHTISNDKGNEYLKEVLDLIKLDSLNEPEENLRRSGDMTLKHSYLPAMRPGAGL